MKHYNGKELIKILYKEYHNWDLCKDLINKENINDKDENGRTFAWYAAKFGFPNMDFVSASIKNGAELNYYDNDGVSPLMIALQYGRQTAVVHLIIDGGAKINDLDEWHLARLKKLLAIGNPNAWKSECVQKQVDVIAEMINNIFK
jgi:ankyrin repeat protein